MEKNITKRLQEFFDNEKFLNTRNSGFRKGDSAVYSLLEITHDIYQGMEDRNHTCAVFLDISKTFASLANEPFLNRTNGYKLELIYTLTKLNFE